MAKATTQNAADEKQVNKAKFIEKERRRREVLDLAHVLSQPEGRRLLWRILGKCKTFESVYADSGLVYYNAGKQDLGHYILSEIVECDEELLFQMMRENKESLYKGE